MTNPPRTYEELAAEGASGVEIIGEFERWDAHRRELEAELQVAKKAMDEFQQPLLDFFMDNSLDKMEMRGRRVKIKSKWRGYPKDGLSSAHVCAALRQCGYSDIVNAESYHWSRISSLIKEHHDGKNRIPPELAEVLDMRQEFTVVVDK